MVFKHNIEHKARPKLLTFMLATFLCLSLIIPMIAQPLQVQADYDGTEGEGGGQYGEGNISASLQNTAILLNIVDAATGEPVTGSVIAKSRNFDLPHNFRSKRTAVKKKNRCVDSAHLFF